MVQRLAGDRIEVPACFRYYRIEALNDLLFLLLAAPEMFLIFMRTFKHIYNRRVTFTEIFEV